MKKSDITTYNRVAWDKQARSGNRWSIPVSTDAIERARQGDWEVVLTPSTPVPRKWFGNIKGKKILGLASGGGQQCPLFSAAGAEVTVFDNSPEQLERDRQVADRNGLNIKTIQGDMKNLSVFEDESFDLIFHPCSNCFVPEIRTVWREAFRVLKRGGKLLSGIVNPVVFTADLVLEKKGIMQMKYSIPYSDFDNREDPEIKKILAEGGPMSFGHSLEEQIGGQLNAGFLLSDFYEDGWPEAEAEQPVHKFLKCYISTLAIKI